MQDKIHLGIAPIGWTNDDLPELGGEITFEQCISEMALAGFQGCEVGNKFPRDPHVLKRFLEIRNLQICNQWFSYELTTKPLEDNKLRFRETLDFLSAMGAPVIGGGETGNSCQGRIDVPVLTGKGMLNDAADWRNYGQAINELGRMAADKGLKLAFHHHMGTIVQSREETDRFLNNTDSRYVWLNYDCGHFTFAGEDPVAALKKYLGRTAHIHLKDVRPRILERVNTEKMSFLGAVKEGIFTIPGDQEGCIDFPAIFEVIKESDYEGWVVVEAEQDPAKANPFEYAVTARRFIRKHLGI